MTHRTATLFYVHDPMCAWCWGFAPTWAEVQADLPPNLSVRYVLGGLAPDTDEPMPQATRHYIQDTWRAIGERLGTPFNFAFWERCQPRRSTYPACRAVLAAADQGAEREMLRAIQHAYYLEARNPSDRDTLCALAEEIGLDEASFADALDAPKTEARLIEDIHLAGRLGAQGFPSLVVQRGGATTLIAHRYDDARATLRAIEHAMTA